MARCAPAEDASGQQQAPQREAENNGRTERPLIERRSRTPGQRLQLHRSEPVNIGIDRMQLGPVLRAEKLSLRRAGDLAQGDEIDTVFACRIRITEADGVDDDAILTRDVCGMLGCTRLAVSFPSVSRITSFCWALLVSNVLMARPMLSPMTVCWPAMPTSV
jgi:hypothetical protein